MGWSRKLCLLLLKVRIEQLCECVINRIRNRNANANTNAAASRFFPHPSTVVFKPDKRLTELLHQVDELSSEKLALLTENERLSADLAAGTQKLEELRQSEEFKSSSITQFAREKESLINQLSWSESQKSTLSSEIVALRKVVDDLSSSQKATIRDAEERESELEAMKTDLEILEGQYEEQIAHSSALNDELVRSMRRRENLQCRICDLESCLIQQREQNSDAVKKATEADGHVHRLEVDLEQLKESR